MGFERPDTLAKAAAASHGDGDALRRAVAEFLDEFYAHSECRGRALQDEPTSIASVEDAWLAAIAEHLARLWDLDVPGWTENPNRFLSSPHFAGGLESIKPILLAESPLAFRRRMIFVEA